MHRQLAVGFGLANHVTIYSRGRTLGICGLNQYKTRLRFYEAFAKVNYWYNVISY